MNTRRPVGEEPREHEYNSYLFELGMYVVPEEESDIPEYVWEKGRVGVIEKMTVTDGFQPTAWVRLLGYGGSKQLHYNLYRIRPAKYSEFRWNKAGFGKTPWFQYWLIVSAFLTIGIGAALSMESYKWTFPLFFALVYGVVELKTYHNFTRKTV